MTSITILCEGATQYNFVGKTLRPHFLSLSKFVKPINLSGRRNTNSIRKQIKLALNQRREHEYVTTMIDLYALGDYPENTVVDREPVRQRVKRIERLLLEDFPNPNFIPYIQLHEFEALVLVDVSQISIAFPGGEAQAAIPLLTKSIGDTEPELIDDGPQTAPSKRIIAVLPSYDFVKSSAAPEIVEAIGLNRLRQCCPNFNAWLTRLEGL